MQGTHPLFKGFGLVSDAARRGAVLRAEDLHVAAQDPPQHGGHGQVHCQVTPHLNPRKTIQQLY
jgi:hypothetical protein